MNKVIIDKETLIDYYSKGYSMRDIGDELGCSASKIHKYLHLYNIKTRPKGIITERSKKKFSKSVKGRPSPRKNVKLTEETKRKLSIAKTTKGVGHKKTRKDGYNYIYFPDHPKSTKDGYIMEHDLIMECYIGRWLKPDEVVHHKNKIRNDNRIENLELMTLKEHARLHLLERYKEKEMMTY